MLNTLQTLLLLSPMWLPSHLTFPLSTPTSLAMPLLPFPSLFPTQLFSSFFLPSTHLPPSLPTPRSTEFLPLEYSSVKGVEEKVFSEQQLLEGYTYKQAQDCYIHASCSLPTYGSVFFPCKVSPSPSLVCLCAHTLLLHQLID